MNKESKQHEKHAPDCVLEAIRDSQWPWQPRTRSRDAETPQYENMWNLQNLRITRLNRTLEPPSHCRPELRREVMTADGEAACFLETRREMTWLPNANRTVSFREAVDAVRHHGAKRD